MVSTSDLPSDNGHAARAEAIPTLASRRRWPAQTHHPLAHPEGSRRADARQHRLAGEGPRPGGGGRRLAAAYVHWGTLSSLLFHSISLTLSWGTDVWLLCDFQVDVSQFKPAGEARLRVQPINCSGCDDFERPYRRMIRSDRVFGNYPARIEYLNEVRWRVLHNFMETEQVNDIVYLDSDVALLAPAGVIFDRALYTGCDAVITFNQISSRIKPVRTSAAPARALQHTPTALHRPSDRA
eukprot:5827122-Prymnesium_polylepis.2